MDFVEHAVPAGAGGEMEECIGEAAECACHAAVGIVFRGGGDRPINYKGAAHDGVAIDEAPVAAVPAAVAVISHHEIAIGRNHQAAAIDVVEKARGPFGA